MNACKLFLFILIGCFYTSYAMADIYEWTDVNGIKHYTNQAPSPGSGLLMKTKSDYNRWYYRTGHRRTTHPNKIYHRNRHQKNHFFKKPYGSNRKIHQNRYRGQVRPRHTNPLRQIGPHQTNKLNNRITNPYNIYRRPSTASRSGGFNGFGNFSRGRSGFRK